jgi:hypothetical protein
MSHFTLQDAVRILGFERHHCYVCGATRGLREQLGRMLCQRCEDAIDEVLLGSQRSRYLNDYSEHDRAPDELQASGAED